MFPLRLYQTGSGHIYPVESRLFMFIMFPLHILGLAVFHNNVWFWTWTSSVHFAHSTNPKVSPAAVSSVCASAWMILKCWFGFWCVNQCMIVKLWTETVMMKWMKHKDVYVVHKWLVKHHLVKPNVLSTNRVLFVITSVIFLSESVVCTVCSECSDHRGVPHGGCSQISADLHH